MSGIRGADELEVGEDAALEHGPSPFHTGLGQTVLYMGLLVMMCGFLGAMIVNASVDSALGPASTDIGLR